MDPQTIVYAFQMDMVQPPHLRPQVTERFVAEMLRTHLGLALFKHYTSDVPRLLEHIQSALMRMERPSQLL